MSEPRPASDWPEDPYPGDWPDHSYVVDADATVHRIEVDAETPSGWAVRTGSEAVCLDDWLRDSGQPGLAERTPVLSFGSNRCPSKVVRQGGPLVNLECETTGLAAVWSHGTRKDGQIVATLVRAHEHEAVFFLSMCTDADIELLDVVEGQGRRYERVELDAAQLLLEDGTSPEHAWAYVGIHPLRWPMAGEDGHPVLLTTMSQEEVGMWREQDPAHWYPEPDHPFGALAELADDDGTGTT
ncbi:hypothetical protein [Aeromicrobium sp.]|uniref:hypothetical protein n=1 Tax=Aeromicrobium sp. TaxID=1871063 RepID=UPI003D6AE8D2